MSNRLSKGIQMVFITNVIGMLFSLITNFALPKYTSIETYAEIRTYQLYVTYIGVLHLGYIDGVYLKYGGRELSAILPDDLARQHHTLFCFQLFATLLLAVPSVITRNVTLAAFTLSVLPFNMAQYYKLLYQATGEFSRYSILMNLTSLFIFLANLAMLFVFRAQSHATFLAGYVLVYLVIWVISEVQFGRLPRRESRSTGAWCEMRSNINSGILLMLGNFSSILLTSIDRWFVMFFLNTQAYALYSFAVSIESMLNVVVTPISTTLYNYCCINRDDKQIRGMRDYILLFAVAVIASAFPASFIVNGFLTKYVGALSVVFFLFAAQIFFIIIKSLFVNLYKAKHMQRVYFVKLFASLGFGVVANIVGFLCLKSKEAFAIGTMLSAVFWFLICMPDFPEVTFSLKHLQYLFFETALFLACGLLMSWWSGLLVYILGSVALSMIYMRNPFVGFMKTVFRMLSNHEWRK